MTSAVGKARLGHSAEALRTYQHSLALAEKLVRDHPDVIDYRSSLIYAHGQIGWDHYRLSGRNQDAYHSFRKALDLAEALARENPDLETAKWSVEHFNHELGRVLARLGKPDEALEHYRKALAICEERERKNPGGVWEQRELAYLDYEMGRIHQAAGRAAESTSALDRARKIFEAIADSKALTPYDRACVHALCAGLSGIGTTELSPHEQAQRRKFAERAVVLLREALSGGNHNPDMIASDIDFEAIKSNQDFQAVLAELRAKPSAARGDTPGS